VGFCAKVIDYYFFLAHFAYLLETLSKRFSMPKLVRVSSIKCRVFPALNHPLTVLKKNLIGRVSGRHSAYADFDNRF